MAVAQAVPNSLLTSREGDVDMKAAYSVAKSFCHRNLYLSKLEIYSSTLSLVPSMLPVSSSTTLTISLSLAIMS